MNALIGLLFCALLGVTLKLQGITALLWFPLGFVLALYISAQIILPLLLGFPRAISLVSKRQMRSGIFIRLLATPIVWFILVFGALFLIGFLWPSVAASVQANAALNLGVSLGTIAIILSPLSKKSRGDFRVDFDQSYARYYTAQPEATPKDDSQPLPSEPHTEATESERRWLDGYTAYQLGEDLYFQNEIQQALGYFDTAVDSGFELASLFAARGNCLQSLQFDLDAIDDFTRAIELEPDDSNVYYMRSISRGAVGDLQGRVDDLNEAIRVAAIPNAANRSHNEFAKERGYANGVAGKYQMDLLRAKLDIERQASDELSTQTPRWCSTRS